ncbi:MAG: hypothetical protein D6696_10650 [Acidobacteria bacterium]|nr:MAG: hypothetical protein D6696_10650 [Acidobacteriota bacterium]
MSMINSFLRPLFDGLLYPFRGLHPLVGLTVVSLVAAIGILYVFKLTSNQDKLAAVKRKIHAGLFEIRLFNDNPRAILRAQLDILRHNLTYLRLAMVPLLWMIVPLVLVIAQLQFHYGYRGLDPGQSTLVKVELAAAAGRPQAILHAPAGVAVEAGPAWLPALNEVAWRIAAVEPGDYELDLEIGGESLSKSVRVSNDVVRRSPIRPSAAFADQLLYPAEPPLPRGSAVRAIHVVYPPGDAGIPGWESEWTWMIVFFVLSMVFAFALRKPLGVTF